MAPSKVQAGTVIAGRYRLVAPLSRGGMGSVWRAEHISLGSPIAIKLIDSDLVEHDEPRARFEQEARAAAALRSPNVVHILDHGVDKDLPFIAMELLEGESLAACLHRLGSIPPAQVVRIFQDVARAIRKAHDIGIIHRDLKPDNIFLVKNEDQEIAKVLDFGIAKAQNPLGEWKGGTRTGALIGTPQYMSPEQAQGLPIDKSSDLWALGVIAFECLCGRLPFPSEKPGELILQICVRPIPVPSHVARVTPRFDAWFARACQREPRARFASARDLADTLAEVLGVGPAPADASGPTQVLSASGSIPVGVPLVAPASDSMAVAAPLVAPAPPVAAATPLMVQRAVAAGTNHYGPGGTQVPLGGMQPSNEAPARLSGTMSGGAVVDSDPATLVVLPSSRTRKLAIGAVVAAALAAAVIIGWVLRPDSHVAPAAPETATAPPIEPSATASATAVAPPSSVTAPSSSSPATAPAPTGGPSRRGSNGTVPTGPKAVAPPRPTASASASATNSRIGF